MTKLEIKIYRIFELMKRLAKGEELYAQNEKLLNELEVDERTLRRYLKDIHELYDYIIITQKKQKVIDGKKVTVYRVADKEKDVSEIFKFFLKESSDLGWLLQIAYEYDPKLLKDERDRFEKILKENSNAYLFISTPFEDLKNDNLKKIFNNLKTAVLNREYRNIVFYDKRYEDVKCLKLVFMSNNWYLAGEIKEGKFKFFRLSFIKEVSYSKKTGFNPSVLNRYKNFFKSIQNPMTLNKTFKTAYLKATPKVAHYFKKDMKQFFPSQEYIKTLNDGSVEFSVKFTQPMEILPFIKQWLPEITITEPQELKKALLEDLRKALQKMK